MLSRRYRLQKDAQVKRVLEAGVKQKFGPVLIFTAPSVEAARFAVVVSKKVAKFAVARNYLRRLTYELIRTTLPLDQLTSDAVIVFLYQPTNPVGEVTAALKQWHGAL